MPTRCRSSPLDSPGSPALDDALLQVAEDRCRLALVNWSTSAAFYPYDGGADLYFPTTAARDKARTVLQAWIPDNPQGL
jgi:hypothetical protein